MTVYCVLSGLTATVGRKLRNLKGSKSVQILPVSQIQPTAHPRPTPSAHSGAPFTKVGHQVPCCWCNPLTLVTTPFLRPAAALSCSHLMNRETMFHGSHICGYMEGSWQGPDVLDSLTIGALYHPLSCGPRAAGNPGKFSAAPPNAPSESGPSGQRASAAAVASHHGPDPACVLRILRIHTKMLHAPPPQ